MNGLVTTIKETPREKALKENQTAQIEKQQAMIEFLMLYNGIDLDDEENTMSMSEVQEGADENEQVF